MSAVRLILGCASVISGIWGIVDIFKYLKAGRTKPEIGGGPPKVWLLLYRSVLPLLVGVILIANKTGNQAAQSWLTMISVILLIWMVSEELGRWLRSWQQGKAKSSRG